MQSTSFLNLQVHLLTEGQSCAEGAGVPQQGVVSWVVIVKVKKERKIAKFRNDFIFEMGILPLQEFYS